MESVEMDGIEIEQNWTENYFSASRLDRWKFTIELIEEPRLTITMQEFTRRRNDKRNSEFQ